MLSTFAFPITDAPLFRLKSPLDGLVTVLPHCVELSVMDELPTDVDSTRHARYWFEAFNGVVMRMALLALVLGAVE